MTFPLVHQPAQNQTSCASPQAETKRKLTFDSPVPLASTEGLGSPSEHRLGEVCLKWEPNGG